MSAEGSTRQRARVSSGRRGGSARRAWRAASRVESWARSGGGEGRLRRKVSLASRGSRTESSADSDKAALSNNSGLVRDGVVAVVDRKRRLVKG